VFTEKEIAYLTEQHIGRLATVGGEGRPHVVPTGFHLDDAKGVLEIGAHDLPDRGQKRLYLTHLKANPQVAFVVDDLVTEPSWAPRGVSVRGHAQIHSEGGERLAPGFGPMWVEIVPESISAWGIDTGSFEPPNTRKTTF
jgi:pyridoxamine 5'-phosphate oxidase family protein